jgi:hypothetical protein
MNTHLKSFFGLAIVSNERPRGKNGDSGISDHVQQKIGFEGALCDDSA